MPEFRVTYLSDSPLPAETIEADRVDVEGGGTCLVFRRQVLVIGQPRDVVVRRVDARQVVGVEGTPDGAIKL